MENELLLLFIFFIGLLCLGIVIIFIYYLYKSEQLYYKNIEKCNHKWVLHKYQSDYEDNDVLISIYKECSICGESRKLAEVICQKENAESILNKRIKLLKLSNPEYLSIDDIQEPDNNEKKFNYSLDNKKIRVLI